MGNDGSGEGFVDLAVEANDSLLEEFGEYVRLAPAASLAGQYGFAHCEEMDELLFL